MGATAGPTAPGAIDVTRSEAANPTGPASVLASPAERRIFVLRNGIRIGGTVLMMVGGEARPWPNPVDPAQPRRR